MRLLEPDQISHSQSMRVAKSKRDLTNRANVHNPMWKSRFVGIPIDPVCLKLQLDIVL